MKCRGQLERGDVNFRDHGVVAEKVEIRRGSEIEHNIKLY
jgi:hypothetical protein